MVWETHTGIFPFLGKDSYLRSRYSVTVSFFMDNKAIYETPTAMVVEVKAAGCILQASKEQYEPNEW